MFSQASSCGVGRTAAISLSRSVVESAEIAGIVMIVIADRIAAARVTWAFCIAVLARFSIP